MKIDIILSEDSIVPPTKHWTQSGVQRFGMQGAKRSNTGGIARLCNAAGRRVVRRDCPRFSRRSNTNIPGESALKYMERAAAVALERNRNDLPRSRDYEISLSFVTEDEIRSLNNEYRAKDSATDVLSFPMGETYFGSCISRALDEAKSMPCMLGDVVICTDRAKRQAAEFGHSEARELVYLFTHSVLHLIGMDHENEDDKTKMRAEEEAVMSEIGLAR